MDIPRLIELTGIPVSELATEFDCSPATIYRWKSGEGNPRKSELLRIQEMATQRYLEYSRPRDGKFTFIDLFAGIGGFRKGFEHIGGKCVFTSEWDKYAQLTYQMNFGDDHRPTGDITQIVAEDIPEHDVLLAGFPCQPFSIAGVSKKASLGRAHGFLDETQGTLFFDVARIIAHHRPKFFLLENVKNLKSHDKGNTFKVIMHTLEQELGYHVQTRVIDARHWVPQHRERVFIMGFRDEVDFDFGKMPIPDPMIRPTLGDILHPEDGTEKVEARFTFGDDAKVLPKYTLTDRLWEYLQEYAARQKAKGNGFGFGLNDRTSVARTLSARYYKDGSEILIQTDHGKPRRLTPRECARLMGFDRTADRRPWIIPDSLSDVQAYRQFGNAVVVPVVEHIALHAMPYIIEEPDFGDWRVYQAQLDMDGRVNLLRA